MNMKTLSYLFITIMIITQFSFSVHADEEDIEIAGVEIEEILNLGSGVLALILFALTLVAYRKTGRTRLVYVSIAFLLFGINGFLEASELVFGEWAYVDLVASVLNFVILLCFFIGILKK